MPPHTTLPRRVLVASALTFAAGVVHIAAAVPHFADDRLLGGGFLATGIAQLLVAGLLLRGQPGRALTLAGIAVHLTAVAAWLTSRTVGLPVGHPGPEPFGAPDLLAGILEVGALIALAGWLRRPETWWRPSPASVLVLAGIWALALGGSSAAVADLGTTGHGHDDASASRATGVADGPHDHEDTGAAEAPHGHGAGDVPEPGSETADAPATGGVMHAHDDGSYHLHTTGDVHVHDDGSTHVHAATLEQPSPTGEPADGHTHAPGEEH